MRDRPLVLAAAALAAGIYAAATIQPGPAMLYAGAAFTACAGLALRDAALAARLGAAATLFAAGALLWTQSARDAAHGDPFHQYALSHPQDFLLIEGTVRESDLILEDTDYARFVLDVSRAGLSGDALQPLPGGALVRWTRPAGPVHPGERVRVWGAIDPVLGPVNHGFRGAEDHWRGKGVRTAVRAAGEVVERTGDPPRATPLHWTSRLRHWQGRRLAEMMPEASLPFVLTVWLGERGTIDRGAYQHFIQSGTAHILAVSGVHVGIIFVSAQIALSSAMPQRRRLRIALTIAAVLLFAMMAGARVSSMRAAFMLSLYCSAELVNRESDAATALAVAAMIFLGMNPNLLFDTAFLLSFSSVASIILFTDAFRERLTWLPRFSRKPLGMLAAAQILPAPLIAHIFHVMPAIGLAANLVVGPLLTIVLWLCFAAGVSGTLAPPLAPIFAHATQPLIWLIHVSAEWAASAPGSHQSIVSPTRAATALFWGASACLALLLAPGMTAPRLRYAALGAVLLALSWAAWRPWERPATIDVIDVGHGDAMFVRTPAGETLLKDGGDRSFYSDYGARVVGPFLHAHGVDRLDYVAVSHPDRDHIGGLFHVIEHFRVGAVLLAAEPTGQPIEQRFVDLCEARGVPVRRLARGDRIEMAGGAWMEVLHPPAGWRRPQRPNDMSLVLRMGWPGLRILLAGDIETEAEAMVAALDCAADILKVPHHGSHTSSGAALLDAVAPRHAAVSTVTTQRRPALGPGVAARYAERGIPLHRTDVIGGIRMRPEAGGVRILGAREKRGYVLAPVAYQAGGLTASGRPPSYGRRPCRGRPASSRFRPCRGRRNSRRTSRPPSGAHTSPSPWRRGCTG